jgi:hypothetical protein
LETFILSIQNGGRGQIDRGIDKDPNLRRRKNRSFTLSLSTEPFCAFLLSPEKDRHPDGMAQH